MPTATSHLLEHLASHGAVLGQLRGESRPLEFGDAAAEYQALTTAVGVAPVFDIASIDVSGADRATFLHNMCTADIKGLTPGRGCEALFTNAQGHVVGYGWLYCLDDRITIDLVGGDTGELIAQLDRYIIREDVTLTDRAADIATLLVAGPTASDLLANLGCDTPDEPLAYVTTSVGDISVCCRRVELAGGNSFLLSADADHVAALWDRLVAAGAHACGSQAVETRRIERGIPLFGVDIDSVNLPQEVARDERAINFNKGCYIGQETVARIDALGHVNRTLGGLRFDGESTDVAPGDELTIDGKRVAQITSLTFSPTLNAPLALAYIRRGQQQPGKRLTTDNGIAEVVALPV